MSKTNKIELIKKTVQSCYQYEKIRFVVSGDYLSAIIQSKEFNELLIDINISSLSIFYIYGFFNFEILKRLERHLDLCRIEVNY